MLLKGIRIGFAITGSFCTIGAVLPEIDKLVKEGADIYPIISETVCRSDTRFGTASDLKEQLKIKTGRDPISTIIGAEPIGPKSLLDILIVAPCTGNSLSKIANAITDTSVTMACKAHMRNCKPLVIAISTNDGLGSNAKNIGMLLNMKNVYFVPFNQDNSIGKPNSLLAKMELIQPTLEEALDGKQVQPILA